MWAQAARCAVASDVRPLQAGVEHENQHKPLAARARRFSVRVARRSASKVFIGIPACATPAKKRLVIPFSASGPCTKCGNDEEIRSRIRRSHQL